MPWLLRRLAVGVEASHGAAKGCVTLQSAFPYSHVACEWVCWYLVVRGVRLLGCPMVASLISEGIAWTDASVALPGFGGGIGNPSRDKKRRDFPALWEMSGGTSGN